MRSWHGVFYSELHSFGKTWRPAPRASRLAPYASRFPPCALRFAPFALRLSAFSFLLSAFLLAFPAHAQLSYVINNGTITITGGCPGSPGTVTIPETINGLPVTSIGSYAFSHCTSLTAITVDALNPVYSSFDGVLFNKDQTTLFQCPGGKTGGYTLPASVTSIGNSAFAGCTVPAPGSSFAARRAGAAEAAALAGAAALLAAARRAPVSSESISLNSSTGPDLGLFGKAISAFLSLSEARVFSCGLTGTTATDVNSDRT